MLFILGPYWRFEIQINVKQGNKQMLTIISSQQFIITDPDKTEDVSPDTDVIKYINIIAMIII